MHEMTAVVYIDFFDLYKFEEEGSWVIEGYTTQPFESYVGVNVPIKYIDGSLGSDQKRVQMRVTNTIEGENVKNEANY